MGKSGNGILIIGGGQAGMQIAASLRANGYDGSVRLIGEESHLPYQRPPLSKAYLTGKASAQTLPLRPDAFYAQNKIGLIASERVESLDRKGRQIITRRGPIAYDLLALTTGARVRRLRVPGAEAHGVHYLRTIDEAEAIKAQIGDAQAVAVIGGGFIGLEVAASARSFGKPVTVFEAMPRLMARVVPPALSDYFAGLHRKHGCELVLDCAVQAIDTRAGRARGVRTGDGRSFAADLIVIGIGVEPCADLAQAAGLECNNGIAVDAYARTSDHTIVAAGDCANHPSIFAEGARVRLESVQNAIDQAKVAALTLLGKPKAYDAVPWFWSDQYDIKLQMVGLSTGADRIVQRGSSEDSKFSLFYFKRAKLVGIDSVNRPADHVLGRRLLAQGIAPSPDQASDESFDLKSLLKQPA